MGYSIYTGASAVLEEARRSNQGTAHPELRTFLRALNAGMLRCPLLEKSLNIIARYLNHESLHQHDLPQSGVIGYSEGNAEASMDGGGAHTNPYIPAFPYLDPEMPFDVNMASYTAENSLNSMAMLDCFPELWSDTRDIICPL
jgi:hypothetical protein